MVELICVPFKKSADVDIVKPLKNLIHSTYNTGNEDFTEAINELSRLRTNAIWKLFERSSLDVLYSYYDQLVNLESKIPPQEVQIPFKWKDAFVKASLFASRTGLTISSLAYERMCILFNMAAMQSTIAAQQPLDTEDSLRLAAKLFQQAAGIFNYMKANILMAVHQETTPDLSPETLGVLSQLMLAQAQEVIAYKCIRDEMKDSMIAKVCSQCEELYLDASRSLQKEGIRMVCGDWSPIIQAKQQLFRGLTQYYQAQVCRANKAVGEEIARLQIATELLKSMREGSPVYELAAKATRQLTAAVRDNDFIYHERIPDAILLEPVPRAPVAQALPPQERWSPKHVDLFEKLVPVAVHQAMQASATRRAEIVNVEINKMREATQLLNSILASLNLPACIEAEGCRGAGLPESIRSKAAAVRAEGGLPALQRLMAELPELLQRNREILTEAERMLREEAEADAALRAQFGARWTRTESGKLTEAIRANASKYSQIIDGAVRADAIVQQKFQQHKESIELLSRSDGEIDAGVPNAPAPTGGDADAVRALRALMTTVEQIKSERDAIESELKCATIDLREKFLSALAADGAVDEPSISAGALGAALAPLQRRAKESLARQETLAEELEQNHAALMEARGGASNRDEVLGKLCAAYDAYQDLTGNLKEGVKFYNDLTQLLVSFQNKVADFCFARKTEKDELLKDLTQEASRSSPRTTPSPRPTTSEGSTPSPPRYYQDAVNEPGMGRRDPPPRPSPPSAGPPVAMVAPSALPYPEETEGMPLPYGMPQTSYPPYAPMPPMYNPYATLPYPHHSRGHPALHYQPYQYPQHPPHPPHHSGYPQPPPPGYNPYHHQ